MTPRRKPLRSHGRRRFLERRLQTLLGLGTFELRPTKGWKRTRSYKRRYLS